MRKLASHWIAGGASSGGGMLSYRNCEWLLVVLSFVIPVLGLLRALQLVIAFSLAQSKQEGAVTILAVSAAIGVGAVWAAHFIASDAGVSADAALLAISASCVCSGALASTSRGRFGGFKLIRGPMLVGWGVAGACLLGIGSTQVNANIGYPMDIVIAALLIAVVVSMVRVWLTLLAQHMANVWPRALAGGVRPALLCHLHGIARHDESLDVRGRCRLTMRQASEHGHLAAAPALFIVALLI